MITDITEVTRQMTGLGDSVTKVHDAMQEVSIGSAETAESVRGIVENLNDGAKKLQNA